MEEKKTNEKLTQPEEYNKIYLDLIDFVSHELKGILSSVILNVYSLKQGILGPINESQRKILVSISRNLDYLSQTVKNFLNLSRIERGNLVLDKKEVLLKEEIFDIFDESFSQSLEEKSLKFENNLEDNCKVFADKELLQVVAHNLISNALKYSLVGGRIIVSSRKIDNEKIEVEVYNDGIPLKEEQLEKLFKRFSRILIKGQEKVKGTGIGLFISKEIVERHNGLIWAEPKPQGNSFKFSLPLKK